MLDIGCGTGNLARTMARSGHSVVAIDADAVVIEHARRQSMGDPKIRLLQRSMSELPDDRYDIVTAVAVVPHLDLAGALTMRRATAPSGRILIVGCYRGTTISDRLVDVIAIPANVLMGLIRSRGAVAARSAMSAPTAPPTTTLAEVRAVAADILPGSRIRRRLFWRYTLKYESQPLPAAS